MAPGSGANVGGYKEGTVVMLLSFSYSLEDEPSVAIGPERLVRASEEPLVLYRR